MEPTTRHFLVSIIIECDPETHLQALDDLNVSFEDEPGVLGSIVTNVIPVIGVTRDQQRTLSQNYVNHIMALESEEYGGDNA